MAAARSVHLPWCSPNAGTDAPAVRGSRRSLSYLEFEREAAGFAEQLRDTGVGAGDVVAVMMPNSIGLLVAILAAWRIGAAATPINPTFTAREAMFQVED